MFIEKHGSIIVIREHNSYDFACIGVAQHYYMIRGNRHNSYVLARKPHDDYTIGELQRFYEDFQRVRETQNRHLGLSQTHCP